MADNLYCLNIRGTNGCGKTILVKQFIENDEYHKEIFITNDKKPDFVFCPAFNLLLIGSYRNKCGGCDTLRKEGIVQLLELAWKSNANIIFEGVLVSDSKEPYYRLMQQFNNTIKPRHFGFVYLDVSYEECLRRIYGRNNNKPIKEELVKQKYDNMIRYKNWQSQFDDVVVVGLDANQSIQHVFQSLLASIDVIRQGHSKFNI